MSSPWPSRLRRAAAARGVDVSIFAVAVLIFVAAAGSGWRRGRLHRCCVARTEIELGPPYGSPSCSLTANLPKPGKISPALNPCKKSRPLPALPGGLPNAQKISHMAFLVRISAAWVPLGAYRLNRRSRYPLLDPLNGHKAVDLPNQRPVISTVLGHDRSHSKKLGSKRPSTDTQTMSITGLACRRWTRQNEDGDRGERYRAQGLGPKQFSGGGRPEWFRQRLRILSSWLLQVLPTKEAWANLQSSHAERRTRSPADRCD